jgi:hypothetical protein
MQIYDTTFQDLVIHDSNFDTNMALAAVSVGAIVVACTAEYGVSG